MAATAAAVTKVRRLHPPNRSSVDANAAAPIIPIQTIPTAKRANRIQSTPVQTKKANRLQRMTSTPVQTRKVNHPQKMTSIPVQTRKASPPQKMTSTRGPTRRANRPQRMTSTRSIARNPRMIRKSLVPTTRRTATRRRKHPIGIQLARIQKRSLSLTRLRNGERRRRNIPNTRWPRTIRDHHPTYSS